jgi:hypothetical protein
MRFSGFLGGIRLVIFFYFGLEKWWVKEEEGR